MTRKPKPTAKPKPSAKPKAAPADATTASVVPAKYRERYADGSCGDDLAVQLKQHLAADDGTVDVAKLRALAELNGVWEPRYSTLNAGLARMTVSNKLRALARKGGTVKWGAK